MSYDTTDYEPDIKLAFDVLPSMSGHAHAVDPDPDAQYESFPVSLCGTALVARDGKLDSLELCQTCLEIAGERQREFNARLEEVPA